MCSWCACWMAERSNSLTNTTPATPPAPSGEVFARAFPFYLQVDPLLRVLNCGPSLCKVYPEVLPGAALNALFSVKRPQGVLTFAHWLGHLGQLCTLQGLGSKALTLRGSAELNTDGTLMFLATPVVTSMEDQARLGLTFNDFAKHDSLGDSLVLAQTTHLSRLDAERLSNRLRVRTSEMTSMLELSKNGMVYFDTGHALLHLNTAYLDMLGLEHAAALDMNLLSMDEWLNQLMGDGQMPNVLQWLMNPDNTGSAGITVRLDKPKAAVVFIDHAANGEGGTVFYLRDVTRETEVDRMKSEFLAAAAHELRTPMVSIFGFTELLLKRKFSEERQADMLQTIHRQSGLLVKMINELLDLARIEARGVSDLQLQSCSLEELVHNSVKGLMRLDTDRQVRMGVVQAVDVWIDPEKMQLAMNNLLSNAFKYSPQGGEVSLATRLSRVEGKRFAVIDIQDHGIGLSPTQLERVFERFYRADTSGNIPGTGLGLSLVKQVAEMHQGRIQLSSKLGQGTTASLWIPIATKAQIPKKTSASDT